MKSYAELKRTHSCGQLRLTDIDKKVTINGWVDNYRNLGGLLFLDGFFSYKWQKKKNSFAQNKPRSSTNEIIKARIILGKAIVHSFALELDLRMLDTI